MTDPRTASARCGRCNATITATAKAPVRTAMMLHMAKDHGVWETGDIGWTGYGLLAASYALLFYASINKAILVSLIIFCGYIAVIAWDGWREAREERAYDVR